MMLAARMVVRRPGAGLATFLAIFAAAGMVAICGTLLESGIRFHGTVARYADAPVVVATTEVRNDYHEDGHTKVATASLGTPRALPAWLTGALRLDPSVGAVVPDTSIPARITTETTAGVTAAVHPWSAARLAPYRLVSGEPPSAADGVVLDADTAARDKATVGDAVTVWTAAGPRHLTVTGVAVAAGKAAPSAFVGTSVARDLLGSSPQVLGLLPRPGESTGHLAAAVRTVLAAHGVPTTGAAPRVYTGANRGRAESTGVWEARSYLIALSSVFGGSTLLVAGFVIANTVGLSVRQRLRDIALLRAVAATPGQVRRMVVGESLFIAAVGAAGGVSIARFGVGGLRDGFVSHGLVPTGFHAHMSWLPPLVAGAAAVLVAVAAAWISALRSSRIRPTAALHETLVEPTGLGVLRGLAGLVALAGGVVLCVVAAKVPAAAQGVAVATICTLTLAIALLGPLLLRLVAATVGRLARVVGVPGRLAAATVATAARRLSPVLTSLVLAIGLVGGMWFVLTSESHTAGRQVAAGLRADQVVVPPAPGLTPAVAHRLVMTPGITAATQVVRSSLLTPDGDDIDQYSVSGIDIGGLSRVLDLDVTAGDIGGLSGDEVGVDSITAAAKHLHVGSSLPVWFGDGTPADLRVAAIYQRGLGFGDVTIDRSVLAAHTAAGLAEAVYLAGTPAGLERARSVIGSAAPPGTRVVSAAQYRVGLGADRAANAWANQVIVAVLLGYVGLAAVNTLIVHTVARRREFGVLRLTGTTRREVLRSVDLEHVLLLGAAVVLGAGVGAAALLPSVHAVTGATRPYLPMTVVVPLLVGTVALTWLAVALPARRAMGGTAIDAVATRE